MRCIYIRGIREASKIEVIGCLDGFSLFLVLFLLCPVATHGHSSSYIKCTWLNMLVLKFLNSITTICYIVFPGANVQRGPLDNYVTMWLFLVTHFCLKRFRAITCECTVYVPRALFDLVPSRMWCMLILDHFLTTLISSKKLTTGT